MKSEKARKQRRNLFNAPMHKKRKWMASHLEEKLLLKYDRRSMPVITGDTVKVMRGSFKGHEDKVSQVNVSKRHVEVEGLTMVKADGKKIAKPVHPSNLLITKLNLTDRWRREKLEKGLSEDAKKEIEKEAEEQLKELEEEKRKAEEEAKKEDEKAEETEMEEEITPKKEETESIKKAPKEKKEEKPKAEPKKKPKKVAPAKKKTTPTKKPEKTTTKKKAPAKKSTKKKKTEGKK